jgi:3D (Asp-Asp-Asp) domain-containing protein
MQTFYHRVFLARLAGDMLYNPRMRLRICHLPTLFLALLTFGCASRSLPPYEKPIARARFQSIRTTAYTHTESDHLQYANKTACSTTLRSGRINSASCDWSRWPVGTVFRILETGEVYQVDDYGWALAGTNTVDLYKPTRHAMNSWGVRRVNIEILQWGDVDQSLGILRQRTGYRHVKRMVDEIKERYAEITQPMDLWTPAGNPQDVRPALIVHSPNNLGSRPALTPFQ